MSRAAVLLDTSVQAQHLPKSVSNMQYYLFLSQTFNLETVWMQLHGLTLLTHLTAARNTKRKCQKEVNLAVHQRNALRTHIMNAYSEN